MGFFKEIIEMKNELGDLASPNTLKAINRRSITNWSKNAVMQFPMLVSRSVDSDSMMMTSKASERKYASLIQIIVGLYNITDATDVEDYISHIHQNRGGVNIDFTVSPALSPILQSENIDVNELIDESLLPISESVDNDYVKDVVMKKFNENLSDTNSLKKSDLYFIQDCINENKYVFEDVLSESDSLREVDLRSDDPNTILALNKIGINEGYDHQNFMINNKIVSVKESGHFSISAAITNESSVGYLCLEGFKLPSKEKMCRLASSENDLAKANIDLLKENCSGFNMRILNENNGGGNGKSRGASKGGSKNYKDRANNINIDMTANPVIISGDGGSRFKNELVDSSVKKSNEMQPTTLQLKVKIKNKEGEMVDVEFMCGVKSVIHPIDSKVMIDNIVDGLKQNRPFFDFIRWTTGEISFFKDFVFGIDRLKIDVLNTRSRDTAQFTYLKRMKVLSGITRKLLTKKQILPNTTLVLSMDELDYIRNEYKIDFINDISSVRKLIEDYFLLGFVVCDKNNEMVYAIYQGDYNYEVLTYSGMEKENSNQARDAQNILKVLGRF